MVPTTGAVGIGGCVLIVTLAEGAEIHPSALVTVKVYVPAGIPETVVLVPVPVVVTAPGERVSVHVPEEGKPLSTTLPVATSHVGWVMVPTEGAEGVGGCAGIITLPESEEIQPASFVTVKLWVPVGIPETVALLPEPVVVSSRITG